MQPYRFLTQTVRNIFESARDGFLVLPDFQRDYVWGVSDTIRLAHSIIGGYPVGFMIAWETYRANLLQVRQFEGSRPVLDHAGLIVDGQQRVQSLLNLLGRPGYFFHFPTGTVQHDPSEPDPTRAGPDRFPLWVLFGSGPDDWEVRDRYPKEQRVRISKIQNAFMDSEVGFLVIRSDRPLQYVREVFVRFNTTGVKITDLEMFRCLSRQVHTDPGPEGG